MTLPETVDAQADFIGAVGTLEISSGVVCVGDLQSPTHLSIPCKKGQAKVSAVLRSFPSCSYTVASLQLDFLECNGPYETRRIGDLPIDSGKLVILDQSDFERHWTETGRDRLGVIITARDDSILRLLQKKYGLKTVQKNSIRAEVSTPISPDLEQEIETFLKGPPVNADFPYMYFQVETNNSFERANYLEKLWDWIPVGNADEPQMLVCHTGYGDGMYDVTGDYHDGKLARVTITFLEPREPGEVIPTNDLEAVMQEIQRRAEKAEAASRTTLGARERRGRILFWIAAAIFLLIPLGQMYAGFNHPKGGFQLFRHLVGPLCLIGSLYYAYQGDKYLRWFMAAICLFKGIPPLLGGLKLILGMFMVTPWEQFQFFTLIAVAPALLVAIGGIYVAAGLMLLCSPSLKTYLRFRERMVNS